MGLDVLVKKLLIPSREDLADEAAREKFAAENACYFHILDEPKEIEKLKKTPWLLEYDDECIIDWDATFNAKGLDCDEWRWFSDDFSTYYFIRKSSVDEAGSAPPREEDIIKFTSDEMKTCVKKVKAICVSEKEYGYQRKGANDKFYEDGKWESDTIVTTKKELISDWKKYFGKSAEFKENILDNFVDGVNVVLYW